MSEPTTTTAQATVPHERLAALDILRGFALLGVLMVNLPFAGMPMAAALTPADGVNAPLSELTAWALVKGLGWTKFVALFSLLFGIGLVLQLSRAEARGASTDFYRRRLAILAVLGLVHGLFFWVGDILLPYAVAGFVLYLLRKKSPKVLIGLAIPLFVIGIGLSTGVALLDGEGGTANQTEATAGSADSTPPTSEETWSEKTHRAWTEGPLGLTLKVRAIEYLGWLAISSIISFNWHVMALFLVGAAIMKRGWLAAEYRRGHGRLACWGLAVGLALESASIGFEIHTQFAKGLPNAVGALVHEVGSLTLAAGYLGMVLWLVHSGKLKWLYTPLSAVGRTALTSYLGQSVAFNVLFPWFGLGLWNALSRVQILSLGAVIFTLQVLMAIFWLRRFTMGPCEWLWRWLTYGRRPPLRVVRSSALA